MMNGIFFLQVGNPELSGKISDDLIIRFGHYVQAINYPTVPRGEEKLRVAPSPHHDKEMMDQFVKDLCVIWEEVGLELKSTQGPDMCPEGKKETCTFCQKPLLFDQMESRVRNCEVPNCPAAA